MCRSQSVEHIHVSCRGRCVWLILGSGPGLIGLVRAVLKAGMGMHRPAEPSASYPWIRMVEMIWALSIGRSSCLSDIRAKSSGAYC